MADRPVSVAGEPRSDVCTRGLVRGGAVVACLAALLIANAAAAPGAHLVVIEQMRFNPPTLTVQRGDRVMWVNKDLVAHTASATSKAFDSGTIAPDASWTYVARERGSYPYVCNFHPVMRGTLTVR